MAARKGHAGVVFNLGCMFGRGIGVSQDYTITEKFFCIAARQRYAGARCNLIAMYAMGEGVTCDYVQAHIWLNLMATQGHKKAKKALNLIAERMTRAQSSRFWGWLPFTATTVTPSSISFSISSSPTSPIKPGQCRSVRT
jgi:TPR repeat protein